MRLSASEADALPRCATLRQDATEAPLRMPRTKFEPSIARGIVANGGSAGPTRGAEQLNSAQHAKAGSARYSSSRDMTSRA